MRSINVKGLKKARVVVLQVLSLSVKLYTCTDDQHVKLDKYDCYVRKKWLGGTDCLPIFVQMFLPVFLSHYPQTILECLLSNNLTIFMHPDFFFSR